MLVIMCPLQGSARGFWGNTNESETTQTQVQTPTATQITTDETPMTSASVSATNKDKRVIKNIEFVGNNIVDQSLILQQMKLQVGDNYSRELVQRDLKAIYEMG